MLLYLLLQRTLQDSGDTAYGHTDVQIMSGAFDNVTGRI